MKTMKLTYFLLIILSIFTSCSDDDSNNTEQSNDTLIGTWLGVSSSFNEESTGIPDSTIIKFTADNRVEFIYKNFGNEGEDISEIGTWTKEDSILTITWDDADFDLDVLTLSIIELNESTLEWEYEIKNEGTLKEVYKKE
ncbi:lipocalin family protein [uncultured Formosa sp.]|uniref:lipocalin family protein n=1 Tax=uncultured Formosa sp. TaxID=255435 RepID=UPI00261BE65D|nr:lipocalin family protein [uncultured Formosa sp.]